GLLDEFANISAYTARAQARPAYQRAFAAQLAVANAAGQQAGETIVPYTGGLRSPCRAKVSSTISGRLACVFHRWASVVTSAISRRKAVAWLSICCAIMRTGRAGLARSAGGWSGCA